MKSKIHEFNNLNLKAMSKRIIIGISLLILGATSSSVSAQQPYAKGIKPHHHNEQRRIHRGYKNGELTKKEVAHLKIQQAQIRQTKRCAKADGVITPNERAMIKNEKANASRNIYLQKHDGQHRF